MSYTYTLRQGIVIESNLVLDVEQIEEMEQALDAGATAQDAAAKHEATLYTPPSSTEHLFSNG